MAETPPQFRLERIRTLRERSEDQAKQALADSLARHRQAQAGVDAAAARINAARRQLSGTAYQATDVSLIRAGQVYLERTERAHRESLQTLDTQLREVNVSRGRLIEAARERQSMDRLRDRSLAAQRLAAERAEAARLDEIALTTFRRRTAA